MRNRLFSLIFLAQLVILSLIINFNSTYSINYFIIMVYVKLHVNRRAIDKVFTITNILIRTKKSDIEVEK